MRVGIDIDDTMLDFVRGLVSFHNERYGTQLSKEDFHSYSFNKVFGGTMDEAVRKVEIFLNDRNFESLTPLPNAVEVVKEIATENEILVITSRHKKFADKTEENLNKYFSGLFSEIVYSYNHYTGHSGRTKEEICKDYGIKLLIEDSSDYADQCANSERKVLLIDQPWNRNYIPKRNVSRVKNWLRIRDYFSSLQ